MNKKRICLTFALILSVLVSWNTNTFADSYVLVFNPEGMLTSEVSYNVDDASLIRHLLYDLDGVGEHYNVYRNGTLIAGNPYTVDSNNSIYFETSTGGTFVITQGSPGADTTPPYFSGINATPSALSAQVDHNIATITFTSSEALASNPVVEVGNNDAVYVGKSGNNYTYTYVAVQGVDPETSVNITISGTDLADNSGSTTCSGCLAFDFTPPSQPGSVQFQ